VSGSVDAAAAPTTGTTTGGDVAVELDREHFQAARLLLVRDRPYYASALFRCPVVVTTAVPIMAVDRGWRLYVNPVAANEMSVTRLAAALAHEVNHLLRDHCGRGEAVGAIDADQHHRWNLAGDAELNDDLKRDGLDVDPDWVYPSTLRLPIDRTAEEYYAAIKQTSRKASCGPGAGGVDFEGDLAGEVPPDDDVTAPAVGEVERRILRRRVAEDVERFSAIGTVPGGLVSWAAELLRPKVDWRRQFASAVRSAVTRPGTHDYDYRRFSRRNGIGHEVRWPGMIAHAPRAAVVVDTSGSMSDAMLHRCLSEVQAMLRSASVADESVRIITVDTAVGTDVRAADVRVVKRMGRGGTDLRVGITRALEGRPRPDVIVVLTDGYTPWPDRPTPGVQFSVGLVGTSRLSDIPPWMRAIEIPVD
jgi:predicted metal-dependent peptidase